MTAEVIPTQAIPSQTLAVNLGGQPCRIILTTRLTGLFIDLYVFSSTAGATLPVVTGVICLNNTLIVREAYRGFVGDLIFWDTQGSDDPDYTGLGGRFALLYVS